MCVRVRVRVRVCVCVCVVFDTSFIFWLKEKQNKTKQKKKNNSSNVICLPKFPVIVTGIKDVMKSSDIGNISTFFLGPHPRHMEVLG